MKAKINFLFLIPLLLIALSCNKNQIEKSNINPQGNKEMNQISALVTTTWNIETKYSSISSYHGKIQQAITDAKAWFNSHQNEELVFYFPAGTKSIQNPNGNQAGILIDNLDPGPNGRLVFKADAPQGPNPTIFEFPGVEQIEVVGNNSKNIMFQSIQFSRGQKTVTQGYVTNKGAEGGKGFVTIKIDPGFPTIPDVFSTLANGKWLKKYNESVGGGYPILVPCDNKQVGWDTYTEVNTREYKLVTLGTTAPSYYSVGDLVAVKCKKFFPAYEFTDCDGITFQNVVWHGQARGLFLGTFDNIKIYNCRIVRLPDNLNSGNTREKKYCISTPSGGPQIGNEHSTVQNNGKNITVEDCRFEAVGDDEIALFKIGGALLKNNILSACFVRSINLNQSTATITGNVIDWCGFDSDGDGCTNDEDCID